MKRVNPETRVMFQIDLPRVKNYSGGASLEDGDLQDHYLVVENAGKALIFHPGAIIPGSTCDCWEICSVVIDGAGVKEYKSIGKTAQVDYWINDEDEE
jgi:hypothetical protein